MGSPVTPCVFSRPGSVGLLLVCPKALKLREKKFDNQTQMENKISSFFDSQLPQFWTSGIESLVKRWTYVLDHDGNYVVD
ncbi:hypothetical protein Y032_0414g1041 [Ancylostoma ceylanicum]|uniref:Uncharacterized protein n=1 Tax=Ancylostoma ceylanicum TaxID=53326 RepID=A0A016X1Z9_9BILA|nr:hypothetical protein Y032_0414g1041 [Ancylostoma ceylanicum]